MTISYKLTQNEYLEAMLLNQKGGLRNTLMGLYAGVATFFVILSTDFSDTRAVITNIFLIFFAVSFYLLTTKLLATYQNKKIYEKSDTLQEEVKLRVSAKGIQVNGNQKAISWDTFSKWKEDDVYYILYTNMRNFKIIPKKSMNDIENKEFLDYLEKQIHEGKK